MSGFPFNTGNTFKIIVRTSNSDMRLLAFGLISNLVLVLTCPVKKSQMPDGSCVDMCPENYTALEGFCYETCAESECHKKFNFQCPDGTLWTMNGCVTMNKYCNSIIGNSIYNSKTDHCECLPDHYLKFQHNPATPFSCIPENLDSSIPYWSMVEYYQDKKNAESGASNSDSTAFDNSETYDDSYGQSFDSRSSVEETVYDYSKTLSNSITSSSSPTSTIAPSPTGVPSITRTPSSSETPSSTKTPTATATISPTRTPSARITATKTPSSTGTPSSIITPSSTISPSITQSPPSATAQTKTPSPLVMYSKNSTTKMLPSPLPSIIRPARGYISIAPNQYPKTIQSALTFSNAPISALNTPTVLQSLQASLSCQLRIPLANLQLDYFVSSATPNQKIKIISPFTAEDDLGQCLQIDLSGQSKGRLLQGTSQQSTTLEYSILSPPIDILSLDNSEFQTLLVTSPLLQEISNAVGSTGFQISILHMNTLPSWSQTPTPSPNTIVDENHDTTIIGAIFGSVGGLGFLGASINYYLKKAKKLWYKPKPLRFTEIIPDTSMTAHLYEDIEMERNPIGNRTMI